MGAVIKCVAPYDEPFWRADGLSGIAISDVGPANVTFDTSPPEGSPGVLLGFVEGRQARRLTRIRMMCDVRRCWHVHTDVRRACGQARTLPRLVMGRRGVVPGLLRRLSSDLGVDELQTRPQVTDRTPARGRHGDRNDTGGLHRRRSPLR